MSTRAMRRILFAAFALCAPLPFFAAAVEVAPLVRLWLLAGVLGPVVVEDGTGGTGGVLAGVLAAQGLLYAGLLGGAARLAARALGRAAPRLRAGLVGAAVAALVALACLPVYRTPLSSRSATSNWLGIFDAASVAPVFLAAPAPPSARAEVPSPPAAAPTPCAHRDPLRQAFFGDLHVHTGLSLDASTQGVRA